MKRLATLVCCAPLIAAALALCTAPASACSPNAAAAVHTAAHSTHRAPLHHSRARHAHLMRHASLANAPASALPVVPPRAPAQRPERKAALPSTLHTLRHAPGSTARFGASLHSMLAADRAEPSLECALSFADLDYSPGMSLTLAGRAPPRAGPSDASVLLCLQRPFTPRRAALIPPTFPNDSRPLADVRLPARPAGRAFPVRVFDSPEPPFGRSHADRPEGTAAWQPRPSSRGSS
jgi:hypothetical protein